MYSDNTEVQYAGFLIRLTAAIIDNIWLYGLIYLVLDNVIHVNIFNPETEYSLILFLFEYILPFIIVITFWARISSTPGKLIFRLKIVDADTLGQVSIKMLIIRYFSYILSMLPLFWGFIRIARDERKQGWHDKFANTVVVREKSFKN